MQRFTVFLYRKHNTYLPYDDLINAYDQFSFTNDWYTGEGKIKKQTNGQNRFAIVKIEIFKAMLSPFIWNVTDEQIPLEFMDVITSTIKRIYHIHHKESLGFKLVGGMFHAVDSSNLSYKITTFRALADAIGYELK